MNEVQNLSHTKETKHLGILKFFDNNKDFGFIASNNYVTEFRVYYQDYYVNSDSFSDSSAKREMSIVVFQCEYKNGRQRAINVRPYSKTDEDYSLAASYYGHELVKIDNSEINMLNRCKVPRLFLLPKLKKELLSRNKDDTNNTHAILKHFICKYKVVLPPDKKRYVFSKDYETDLRNEWESIFDLLTSKEWISILNHYPPAVIYVKEESILHEWLDQLSQIEIIENTFDDLVYSIPLLPEPAQSKLSTKIKEIADNEIISKLSLFKEKNYVPSLDLERNFIENDSISVTRIDIEYDTKKEVNALTGFTTRNFDDEINECIEFILTKEFHKVLNEFPKNHGAEKRNALYCLYKDLANKEDSKHEVFKVLALAFQDYNKPDKLNDAINFIIYARNYDSSFGDSFLDQMSATIEEKLQTDLSSSLSHKSASQFRDVFEKHYSFYTSECKQLFVNTLFNKFTSQIRDSDSIDILIAAASSKYGWISHEIAIRRCKEIVNDWQYIDINKFVSLAPTDLDNPIEDLVFIRAITIIRNFTLQESFDGNSAEAFKSIHGASSPLSENISFLNKINKFRHSESSNNYWNQYINSLSYDDKIALFINNVIDYLPKNIVESIIQKISLESTSTQSNAWYSIPTLSDERISSILSSPEIDIFSPIARILCEASIDQNNIALYVWLTELLAYNRPDEMSFSQKLTELRKSVNNPRLAVILWAVHFRTKGGPPSALAEIFPWFPPYLQIRVVKELFSLLSRRKINHSAQSLYSFLTSNKYRLCLPVEILFAYLLQRENDSSAKFKDSDMLKLIEGRNDHSDWIHITEFMEPCLGRYNIDNYWDNGFYNGILKWDPQNMASEVCLYLPFKMIDKNGVIQKYNNAYFHRLENLIHLNFQDSEYVLRRSDNGQEFIFKQESLPFLQSLTRDYNVCDSHPFYRSKYSFIEKEKEARICECRLTAKPDNNHLMPFYWCKNKRCFRPSVRLHSNDEWIKYTVLDFMSILHIPMDHTNREGVLTKFGHFILFSGYLNKFEKFYEHLKCRNCGELLHPKRIGNYGYNALSAFVCKNEKCEMKDSLVYLNHCFNSKECANIIDSRDSKQCPNGLYICPSCGSCCSNEVFQRRLNNLSLTGGVISQRIRDLVQNNCGHNPKEFYCYNCGTKISKECNSCQNCGAVFSDKYGKPLVHEKAREEAQSKGELPF